MDSFAACRNDSGTDRTGKGLSWKGTMLSSMVCGNWKLLGLDVTSKTYGKDYEESPEAQALGVSSPGQSLPSFHPAGAGQQRRGHLCKNYRRC